MAQAKGVVSKMSDPAVYFAKDLRAKQDMEPVYEAEEICSECGNHLNLSARDDVEFCECEKAN